MQTIVCLDRWYDITPNFLSSHLKLEPPEIQKKSQVRDLCLVPNISLNRMSSCGFDSLPNQVTTRHTIHGLSFNVLVVGPTGIGKTTLINSLFDFDYGDSADHERDITNVTLRAKEFRPQNKTIEMKLTIIESKGFNNQLDKSESYRPIVDYIDARYEEYLKNELRVQETRYNDISDNRVHCCIYMISPTGDGLKSLDLVTMKHLQHRVCLIPVIAKSDVLTKSEKLAFKERVRQQITMNGIEIYLSDEHHLPIAVAASNEIVNENGKRQRVRAYPWGRMNVELDSDFSKLRDLVLRSNMLSLVEYTNRVHYEKYRREVTSSDRISYQKSGNDSMAGDKPSREFQDYLSEYEKEKASLLREIERLEKERLKSPYKRSSVAFN